MMRSKKWLPVLFFIPVLLSACNIAQKTNKDNAVSNVSTLSGSTKKVSTEVDDLFSQLKINKTSNPIEHYAKQVREAIIEKMVNADEYKGKKCTARLSLQRDGQVKSPTLLTGDPELCKIVKNAIEKANIPAAPDEETWKVFRNAAIDIKL